MSLPELSSILESWHKKRALAVVVILISIAYFKYIPKKLSEEVTTLSINGIYVILIYLLLISLLVLFWYISTNRLPLPSRNKRVIALAINIDDESLSGSLKRDILNQIIEDINSSVD